LQKALAECSINGALPSMGRIYSMDTLDEETIIRHCSSNVGVKDVQCSKCSAYMFGGECCNQLEVNKPGGKHRFKMCCGDGQIEVRRSPQIEKSFEDLVINELGHQLPSLNSLVAFAGCSSFKSECPGKQYSYKILGHFGRVICTNLKASPTFSGVYIFDADEQVRLRHAMQSDMPSQDRFSVAQISAVTAYLLDVNPFAVTMNLCAASPHKAIEIHSGAMYTMKSPASQGGEVAAIFANDGVSRPHFGIATLKGNSINDAKSIHLQCDDNLNRKRTQKIEYDHGSYDALRFPVLFPTGVQGWNRTFKRSDVSSSGIDSTRRVTLRQYYSYMLQDRPYASNLLMKGRRLLQEYIVDAGSKIEDNDLQFQQNNQGLLRADRYSSIKEALDAGFTGTIGRHFSKPQIMSKSVRGSPAQKRSKYKDFMAAFLFHGGVDAFITVTANPYWSEVQESLPRGYTAEDRADIVGRVFKLKLDILIDRINSGILGQCSTVGYVVEFQKR
jgi:hypothetical protein